MNQNDRIHGRSISDSVSHWSAFDEKKKERKRKKKKRASKDGASNHRRRASFFTQPRLRSSKFAFYHLDSVDSQANRRTNKSEKDTLSRGIRVVVKKKNTFSINKNIETRGCACVCGGDGFPSFFSFFFFLFFGRFCVGYRSLD